MLSGNGTIDYNVEAHTLDVQETSAARQGSTTRNIQGSITKNFQKETKLLIALFRVHKSTPNRLSNTATQGPSEVAN